MTAGWPATRSVEAGEAVLPQDLLRKPARITLPHSVHLKEVTLLGPQLWKRELDFTFQKQSCQRTRKCVLKPPHPVMIAFGICILLYLLKSIFPNNFEREAGLPFFTPPLTGRNTEMWKVSGWPELPSSYQVTGPRRKPRFSGSLSSVRPLCDMSERLSIKNRQPLG